MIAQPEQEAGEEAKQNNKYIKKSLIIAKVSVPLYFVFVCDSISIFQYIVKKKRERSERQAQSTLDCEGE